MAFTDAQREAIYKILLDANTDQYFDQTKPIDYYLAQIEQALS